MQAVFTEHEKNILMISSLPLTNRETSWMLSFPLKSIALEHDIQM